MEQPCLTEAQEADGQSSLLVVQTERRGSGIKGCEVEERGRALNGSLDSCFYFEVCQLLNTEGTLDQLWKLRFRAVSSFFFFNALGAEGVTSVCFSSLHVLWGFCKAFFRCSLRRRVGGVIWRVGYRGYVGII